MGELQKKRTQNAHEMLSSRLRAPKLRISPLISEELLTAVKKELVKKKRRTTVAFGSGWSVVCLLSEVLQRCGVHNVI